MVQGCHFISPCSIDVSKGLLPIIEFWRYAWMQDARTKAMPWFPKVHPKHLYQDSSSFLNPWLQKNIYIQIRYIYIYTYINYIDQPRVPDTFVSSGPCTDSKVCQLCTMNGWERGPRPSSPWVMYGIVWLGSQSSFWKMGCRGSTWWKACQNHVNRSIQPFSLQKWYPPRRIFGYLSIKVSHQLCIDRTGQKTGTILVFGFRRRMVVGTSFSSTGTDASATRITRLRFRVTFVTEFLVDAILHSKLPAPRWFQIHGVSWWAIPTNSVIQ